jgi:hypothetical protein
METTGKYPKSGLIAMVDLGIFLANSMRSAIPILAARVLRNRYCEAEMKYLPPRSGSEQGWPLRC